MHFYLEENRYNLILFASKDPFLINNVASGILDCSVKWTSETNYEKIINHEKYQNLLHGIFIRSGHRTDCRLDSVYIANEPSIRRKIELIKLRTPAFAALLQYYNEMMVPNLWGFGEFDPFVIHHFLKDPIAIKECADMISQEPDFLEAELRMVTESLLDDRFRLFTVATVWKNKINDCQTQEDINRLMEPMYDSFKQRGVRIDV